MASVCAVLATEHGVKARGLLADERELIRIRGEFLEMPGLCLTQGQAERLWGMPCGQCEALLAVLLEEQFLARTADGRFVRFGGGR